MELTSLILEFWQPFDIALYLVLFALSPDDGFSVIFKSIQRLGNGGIVLFMFAIQKRSISRLRLRGSRVIS